MRAESELKGERNCWMAGEKRRKVLAIAVLLLVSALLLLIPPWGEFRGAFGLALTLAWISGISFWKHRRVPAILGLLVVGYLAVSSVLASLQRPPTKLYTYRMAWRSSTSARPRTGYMRISGLRPHYYILKERPSQTHLPPG